MIPKKLQPLVPPIVGQIYLKYHKSTIYRNEFFDYWRNVKPAVKAAEPELAAMIERFINSPSFNLISDYWHRVNMSNIGGYNWDGIYVPGLLGHGVKNSKQAINNYFAYLEGLEGDRGYSRKLPQLVDIAGIEQPISTIFKKHEFLTWEQSINYNIVTLILYQYVKDKVDVILAEPSVGNAPVIEIEGISISQDCLNSAMEYQSITDAIGKPKTIMEFGAGAGRTAYYFLSMIPDCQYIIVDIPPAAYVSKYILTSLFPDSNIAWLLPHEALGKHYIGSMDLAIGINCMQEFPVKLLAEYMELIDYSSRHFYIKMQKEVPLCFDAHIYTDKNMPFKDSWQQIFARDCAVPSFMVEHLYKVK